MRPPSGTVTFLFTDIEDSTRLWEQHRESMRAALERHDGILRAAIEAHGGYVFSTAGDAFSASFWRPGDAVNAALDAQRALRAEAWPDGVEVRVRMGLHLGVAQEREGNYFGPVLNRAARLMGLANGGQVLVSLATEEVIRDALPGGVELRSLGEHPLRGLSRPETVFQLVAPDLRSEFPPIGPTMPTQGNLPTPPTSFVGRVDEVARLAAELPTRQLVTLVGPGGVGKTRLSIEAARAAVDSFPDGSWFVDLAPLSEPAAVVHALASVFSVSTDVSTTLLDAVVAALVGRQALIVLDNCEHVIDAAAEVAALIGRGAPTTTVLASSREPLGVAGEQRWPVSPLDTSVDAVELFIHRSRAVDPSFRVDEADRAAVVELCNALDGIPLAVELAAARVGSMTVREISAKLDDRFRILRTAPRGGGAQRHQAMRATLEWSYRLLAPAEQALFDRLAVFAGTFDHAAAEAVCAGGPVDEVEVVDLLDALVARSMVQAQRIGAETRFRLLETMRHFGLDHLVERVEQDALRRRHLVHYVDRARTAREAFEGRDHDVGRELFEAQWDNLRVALDHAEATGDEDAADRLVRDTFWYAFFVPRVEHDAWALRRAEQASRPVPEILGLAAFWVIVNADHQRAERLGRRAIDAAASPDDPATALGWLSLFAAYWYSGRPDDARAADLAAKQAARRSSDRFTAAVVISWIHTTARYDPEHATAVVDEAAALVAGLGNVALDAFLAGHRGIAAFIAAGDPELAIHWWRRAADLARRSRMGALEGADLMFLAIRSPEAANEDPASRFHEALERTHALRLRIYVTGTLTGLAAWWAQHDELADAARVVGYLDEEGGHHQTVADLRTRASELIAANPDAPAWRAEGAAMTRDEIVAYCLDRLERSP